MSWGNAVAFLHSLVTLHHQSTLEITLLEVTVSAQN